MTLIYDDIGNTWLAGGGARRTFEVARRLALRHSVTVIAAGYPSARAQQRDGVRYIFTPPADKYVVSRLQYMRNAPLLARKLPADLVVEVFSAYNPLFSPRWAKSPTLGVLHNIYRQHAGAKYGLLGRLVGLVERPALAQFRHYLAVSHGLADQLQQTVHLRGKRLAVIPNGIDAAFFGAPHTSGRRDFALYVGRLDIYQKGLDTLIAALYRASHSPPFASENHGEGLRLIIAGSGPPEQEHRLRDLIAGYGLGDRVELLGRVSQAEAADLLHDAACRFAVLPSRHEAWGMAAAEAGAAARALLGFDISGLREAAPKSAHGLLLPSPASAGGAEGETEEQRTDALAAGLTQLWCNPNLANALGARGRNWAVRYTWDAVAAAEEQYYLSLLNKD